MRVRLFSAWAPRLSLPRSIRFPPPFSRFPSVSIICLYCPFLLFNLLLTSPHSLLSCLLLLLHPISSLYLFSTPPIPSAGCSPAHSAVFLSPATSGSRPPAESFNRRRNLAASCVVLLAHWKPFSAWFHHCSESPPPFNPNSPPGGKS